MTLRFSLSFLRIDRIRTQSALQTLVFAMAETGENLSSLPGNTDALPVDSSKTQIDGAVADSSENDDFKYGFQRPEMYKNPLSGTLDPYDRHLFLCFENPDSWPARVEAPEYDPLPSLLADALKSRQNEILGKIRLTICEARYETDFSHGDILIFPDMVKYRGLTHLDVDNFVEDVLVKGERWATGMPVGMEGSYIFVCAHGSRDRRCGVCGPVLVEKFKEEIGLRSLTDRVFVSPCSHIGGHKYAGNLIIFGQNSDGKVMGHWYGYVTPNDVSDLLDRHIGKGEIIERIWRGQMCSSIDEGKKIDEWRKLLQENGDMAVATVNGENTMKDGGSCCQGASGFSCCRDEKVEEKSGLGGKKSKGLGKVSAWMETWDQSDVLVAVGIIGAVASVAVAYSFYRRSG